MKKSKKTSSEKHIILVTVLLVTDFLTILNTYCVAITPEDLIQILSGQHQPVSGRVTFVRNTKKLEIKVPEGIPKHVNIAAMERYAKANADTSMEVTIIFQADKQRIRLNRKDLRDVQAILDEYNIPEQERLNVDKTSTDMFQDKFTVIYSGLARNILLHDKSGGLVNWQLNDRLRQGIFPAEFFREDFIGGLEIDEISVDNKDMLRLRVEVNDPSQGNGEYEIDFDPSLGYRYLRCARFMSDGTLAHEILLSDYRDVDGYVMPFQIKESNYKSDGTLRRSEEISVKTAEFDEPVTEEDFAIAVPEGTSLTCNVEGIQKHFRLQGPESLTIESMIAKAKERMAGKLIYNSLKDKPLPDIKQFAVVQDPNQTKDKMILVCFFDMNQRPSRNCLLQLSKRAQELMAKDVVVVAVQASKVDDSVLKDWVEKNNIPFPVGMIQGDEEKIRFTWGVRSLPWLILTDKEHIVCAEGFALAELDEKLNGNSNR